MIVVIGAGIGGLSAAAYLARQGRQVHVLEARDGPGGLASSFEVEGLSFDAGPYVLLDRPGLEWSFRQLGVELASLLDLIRVDDVYQVEIEGGPAVRIHSSAEKTAAGLETLGAGTGKAYLQFVEETTRAYDDLSPLQFLSRPGLGSLLRAGAWSRIPFLLRPLSRVLSRAGLPEPLARTLSIWTHVAGQTPGEAPSPMAFVPSLIHHHGAYVPRGGMGRVALALEKIGREAGATFRYGARVRRILAADGRVRGVQVDGEKIDAEAVVSDVGGLRTYLELLDGTPDALRARLEALPLQTPGVCAYLSARGAPSPPFLKFFLPRQGLCRLLVLPGIADPSRSGTARLLGPVDTAWARAAGPEGQRAYLESLASEPWWRAGIEDARTVASRIPVQWGADFNLYRDSMNPVMTARFMRRGRLPHRSPVVRGLFLAGSSTHPGQWVSFCAISGILAAKELAC